MTAAYLLTPPHNPHDADSWARSPFAGCDAPATFMPHDTPTGSDSPVQHMLIEERSMQVAPPPPPPPPATLSYFCAAVADHLLPLAASCARDSRTVELLRPLEHDRVERTSAAALRLATPPLALQMISPLLLKLQELARLESVRLALRLVLFNGLACAVIDQIQPCPSEANAIAMLRAIMPLLSQHDTTDIITWTVLSRANVDDLVVVIERLHAKEQQQLTLLVPALEGLFATLPIADPAAVVPLDLLRLAQTDVDRYAVVAEHRVAYLAVAYQNARPFIDQVMAYRKCWSAQCTVQLPMTREHPACDTCSTLNPDFVLY